jgi:putative ABC transport system ATP-binding protein
MRTLEMRNVSKHYGSGEATVHALEGIDLSVEKGSLVAVMGPSGSGKSSLLTIAGTLEDPSSGDVVIDGQSVISMSRNDKARLRRRRIGFVFQDYNLLPGLTALENVALPLELDGMSQRRAEQSAAEALETLGVADRSHHYPDQMSGGERQRASIARSIIGERSLVLADEPSGALDSENGEAVVRLIRAACHQGVAAVMVTHDAKLASWADTEIFLRDGRLVDRTTGIATPEEVVAEAKNS